MMAVIHLLGQTAAFFIIRGETAMKTAKVWVVALALLALLAGAAQAEMFVEAYLGGNWAANAPDEFTIGGFSRPRLSGHIAPAFQGGLKLGLWFEKTGVLAGVNFPAWMRYFGFHLDFSYHALNFPRRPSYRRGVRGRIFQSEGAVATLAFMFAGRYGFLPDQEVPFGRLQPYVAVGPALMFSWQLPTFSIPSGEPGDPWKPGSSSSTNIGLAVEAGLRWMALKNVSLDVSFKYRYFNPTYKYKVAAEDTGSFFRPNFNLFSIQAGAAYHF
jgi:opacity protein-like surface antigen